MDISETAAASALKISIYEGCPSKLWTFVITQDCVSGILWTFNDMFINI